MKKLPNLHPGEVLKAEFPEPMGISQYKPAKAIGVQPIRIGEICAGRRSVSADSALRLSRAFGTTPGFWLGLQADYDTEEAEHPVGDALNQIQRLVACNLTSTPNLVQSALQTAHKVPCVAQG